ncbi:MAG: YHYH protein [Paracoccaceae bacterium]
MIAAKVDPIADHDVSIRIEGDQRVIRSNSITAYQTGNFPNNRNPHVIREQRMTVRLPKKPVQAEQPTFFNLGAFGIALNGVVFVPQAAEWYLGQQGSDWQYEPLGAAVALGLDARYAHVQRSGKYQHEGLPDGLMKRLGVKEGAASPIVGWSFDGFPIYALFVDQNGKVRELDSGYTVKSGKRPDGGNNPGGTYDGTFTADYEWTGAGDLDECNGAFIRNADFPGGTYAYFLTRTYPVIPRCFHGTPVEAFRPRRLQS